MRAPLMLAACVSALLLSFFLVPFSKLFLLIAAAVGLVLSIISIDELTGGRMLSGWDVAIFAVGLGFAHAIASDGAGGAWWAWIIQFLAATLCVELAALIAFRSRIERFCQRKVSG